MSIPISRRRTVVIAGCLAAGAILFLGMTLLSPRSAPATVTVSGGPAVVGAPAPDFSTRASDGTTVRLRDLRGRAVLVNFWATWCTACEVEMPAIQAAADRYQGRGLTVVALNYRQSNVADMRAFMERVGAHFPAVYDPDGRIAGTYGVAVGLPESVFIDRSGKVAFIQLGQMSSSLLEARLHSIL